MKDSTLCICDKNLTENGLSYIKNDLLFALSACVANIKMGGKIIVCGNGGSASDAQHIVGELSKSFILPRTLSNADKKTFIKLGDSGVLLSDKLQYGIPAIALTGSDAISTSIINDIGGDFVFAQQTFALINPNDVFIGISTSGNANNVFLALLVAKSKGAFTLSLTGKSGGKLKSVSDCNINVKLNDTFKIQEKHLPIYHTFCLCLENELFGD